MANGMDPALSDLVFYKALYNYVPSGSDIQDGYIEIREGDILEVLSPLTQDDFSGSLEQPQGWLEGSNQRTNQVGLFPGTYIEYDRTEKVPQPPVKPPPKMKNVLGPQEKTETNDDSGYGSPRSKQFSTLNSLRNLALISLFKCLSNSGNFVVILEQV